MTPAATEKGEGTRQRLIEVAARHFADHGYAGTSLNDLVRLSGLTKGAFYFHFPSKERLALDVIKVKREQWRRDVIAAAAEQERASQQLAAIVRVLAGLKERDPSAAAIGRLCRELADLPELRSQVSHFEAWIETTARLLEQARAEGDLDLDVDVEAAARFAVAAYCGAEQIADLQGRTLSEGVEDLLAFILRAVGLRLD